VLVATQHRALGLVTSIGRQFLDLRCTTSTSSGTDGARHSIFGSPSEAKAVTVRQTSWNTIRAEEHEPLTYPVGRSVELKPPSRAAVDFREPQLVLATSSIDRYIPQPIPITSQLAPRGKPPARHRCPNSRKPGVPGGAGGEL
jgi:hypothetical protein